MKEEEAFDIFQAIVKQRIFLGYIVAVLFLWYAAPTRTSIFAGLFFCIIGEIIRTLSAGTIMKNKVLTTIGPYSYVRNPLYLGSFIIGIGVCVMGQMYLLALIFLPLFYIIYNAKIKNEEVKLRDIFKEKFDEYVKHVPPLLPRLTPWKKDKINFELRLVRVHKEYQAWLGIYAVTMIMFLKVKEIV